MPKPQLHVFAISHFCEKGRWALDHFGVDHDIRYTAPGFHLQLAQALELPKTSLPILVAEGEPIQGSARIIDWLDAREPDEARRLTPESQREECIALERRADEWIGVHARRAFYSEALFEQPEPVLALFMEHLPAEERETLRERWDGVRQLMKARMDLGAEQGIESADLLEHELDRLDRLLADGRRHLVGDRFTRADLAVASLLAPIARPPKHPVYGPFVIPPKLATRIEGWLARPSLQWVLAMYRDHRPEPTT